MNNLHCGLVFGCLFLIIQGTWAADPSGRVALVVGIDDYPDAPLKNAVSDSAAVKEMLIGSLGFDRSNVVHCVNPTRLGLLQHFEEFKSKAANAEIVLVYYAGHGMEDLGGRENYLIPVDAPVNQVVQSEAALKAHGVNFIGLSNEMAESSPGAKIWLLDCCRERPAGRAIGGTAGAGGGLPQYEDASIPANTLYMFACAPGRSYSNGWESGPFTEALLQILPGNERPLANVFTSVSKKVQSLTNGQQVPWVRIDGSGAVLFRSSFFATGSADSTTNANGKGGKEVGGQ